MQKKKNISDNFRPLSLIQRKQHSINVCVFFFKSFLNKIRYLLTVKLQRMLTQCVIWEWIPWLVIHQIGFVFIVSFINVFVCFWLVAIPYQQRTFQIHLKASKTLLLPKATASISKINAISRRENEKDNQIITQLLKQTACFEL